MKQLFVLLLLLGSLSDAWGQTKTYTLKECVEMGIRKNLSLRNSRVSVQKSKTAWTQSRARLLPVLSADFQMADYLMKPANVTTGALLGSDFPDDPTWQKIQSMQYAMTSGIQLGVPLYNQTILSATKVARTLQEISNLSYEKAVEDLTLQIGHVYYLAQASLEQQNLFLWFSVVRRKAVLELGIFRYRYTWYSIGIFLLLMLINSSTLFVTTYLKLSTCSGNLESATVSCWAIPGCLAGLVFTVVCVLKGVHFRYIYAAGFLLMLGANLYMYFHYQTMGVYGHTIPPTLLHYAGMLVLYSVTCAFAMKHLPIRYFATWLFLMVAVRNVVAPAIGTFVYANWLQERQQHYITRFAQDVRLDNPQSSAPFVQAARLGQRQGKDSFEASRWASTLIKGQVSLQATLVAMKDITGSIIWICMGSVLLVLCVPYYKQEKT